MQAATNHARTDQARSRLYCAYDEDGQAYQIDGGNNDLNLLIDFMNQIIYGTELPYRIVDRGRGPVVVKRALAVFVPLFPAMIRLYDSDLAYSPDLALFFETYRSHPVSQQPHNDNTDGVARARLSNDFVTTMRLTATKKKIRRKISDWRRNADENRKRLGTYMAYLFERYARLCVIRLDLHYRKAQFEGEIGLQDVKSACRAERCDERKAFLNHNEDDNSRIQRPSQVSLERAKADWKHFVDNTRGKPSIFRSMVGYIVSFEYSKHAGFHIHVAMLFDGSAVHKDEWLAEKIGEYWVKVTAERGYFYNCNLSWSSITGH